MSASGSAKRGYHHGDLRRALVDAAAKLAEEGGPEAVTVRAAARTVGVTPTAAYRHFDGQEQLLEAAKEKARQRMVDAVQNHLRALPRIADPVQRALTTARGYVSFATAEPGLFRTAFQALSPSPFLLLTEHLAEFGPAAEIAAWSAVHGFAMLTVDGSLRHWPEHVRDAAMERMLLILIRCLAEDPDASLAPQ